MNSTEECWLRLISNSTFAYSSFLTSQKSIKHLSDFSFKETSIFVDFVHLPLLQIEEKTPLFVISKVHNIIYKCMHKCIAHVPQVETTIFQLTEKLCIFLRSLTSLSLLQAATNIRVQR